jgi:hypothetical protein
MTVDGLSLIGHEPVTLAFWECGYIEVDVGREHPCDGRDVCVASYRRYVPEPALGERS